MSITISIVPNVNGHKSFVCEKSSNWWYYWTLHRSFLNQTLRSVMLSTTLLMHTIAYILTHIPLTWSNNSYNILDY